MGEENRSLLEEEIKAEIKRLGSLESGSPPHSLQIYRPVSKPSLCASLKKLIANYLLDIVWHY